MTTFETIRSEGGLLPPDLLARIALLDKDVPGLEPEDYRLAEGERLSEAISRAWARLLAAWRSFQTELAKVPEDDPATTVTRERFLQPLLVELGFGRVATAPAIIVDDRSYAISHAWGSVPIHLLGARVSLEKKQAGLAGAARSSPHGLVQDLLNRSEPHLWALLSNGLVLRLLRDHHSLTTQAYVEIDLEAMFEEQRYADFVVLWLVCHQSRFDAPKLDDCWLERWFGLSRDEGVRALDDLRDGVERAIEALGAGFLRHPHNAALVRDLAEGTLDKQDYYRELLRLVYRLIFLFSAEDREVLLDPKAPEVARRRYQRFYATRQLRELAGELRGGPHGDLWDRLRVVMSALDEGSPALGLPALGSFLWSREALPHLGAASISNADFLGALRALSYLERDRQRFPIAWRTVAADELGSIYEGLLELHPRLDARAGVFELDTAAGNERKKTGSYYTPTSLVDCLLDSALDPVIEAAVAGKSRADAEQALLALKVVDPACGSGHFLVAAARRMARRLAAVRTGDNEPSPPELRHALRDVVGRCIYGVDLNEMAVELCKVALWMEAVEPGKPLSFLDAHIQHGNALIGATPALIARGIADTAWDPIEGDDKAVAKALKKRNREARKQAQGTMWDVLATPGAGDLATAARDALGGDDDALADVRARKRRWETLRNSPAFVDATLVADTWCAAFVWPKQEGPLAAEAPTEENFARIRSSPASASRALRSEVGALAFQYTFFHWHLAFPDVFSPRAPSDADVTSWDGGFSAVIGNPPWDRISMKEKEWFASRDASIHAAATGAIRAQMIEALRHRDPTLHRTFLAAKRSSAGEKALARTSGAYPLCGQGDVNTFALFAERGRQLTAPAASRCGLILPTGIATADTTQDYFAALLRSHQLVCLLDFDNRSGFFPAVQGNVRFCVLVLTTSPIESIVLGSQLTNVASMREEGRLFTMSPAEIERINPETLSCPLFVSEHDAKLISGLYARNVHLVSPPGRQSDTPWRVDMQRMLHMGDDSGFFRTAQQLVADDWELNGNEFRRGQERFLPLYEAKLAHQFNHRASTFDGIDPDRMFGTHPATLPVSIADLTDPDATARPRYWVHESSVREVLSGRSFLLGFRDAVSATADARSLVATILPPYPAGDTIKFLYCSSAQEAAAVAAWFNSFVTDYVFRQKAGGAHASFFILRQLPIFPRKALDAPCPWSPEETTGTWLAARVLELSYTSTHLAAFARELGYEGTPFRWDEERRRLLRAELDSAIAILFGVARADLEYILDAFTIVRDRDISEVGHYRTQRAVLENYDALSAAMASERSGRSLLQTRAPTTPSAATNQLAALRAAIALKEAARVQTDNVPYFEDLAVAAGQFDTSQAPRSRRKVSIIGSRSFEQRPGIAFFVAPTRGRSMEPLIRDGDLCVYERSASSATGAIVLVQRAQSGDGDGGRFVVKERGNGSPPTWRSRNPEYPPIVADPEDAVVARWVESVQLVDTEPPANTPRGSVRQKRARRG